MVGLADGWIGWWLVWLMVDLADAWFGWWLIWLMVDLADLADGWFGWWLIWLIVDLADSWFGWWLIWLMVDLADGWFGWWLNCLMVDLADGWFDWWLIWLMVGLADGSFGWWFLWLMVDLADGWFGCRHVGGTKDSMPCMFKLSGPVRQPSHLAGLARLARQPHRLTGKGATYINPSHWQVCIVAQHLPKSALIAETLDLNSMLMWQQQASLAKLGNCYFKVGCCPSGWPASQPRFLAPAGLASQPGQLASPALLARQA